MIPAVVPSVKLFVVVVAEAPAVVLVVSVSLTGRSNSSCAKAKDRYCCPGMALDAKTPVAATEKNVAAKSNPFVKISCNDKDFII